MRKFLIVSFLVLVLAAAMAPAAFAWDRAEGCTTDGYGNPWTWGGTVTCRQTFQPYVVVGQGTLDANGCFSVFIGNGHEVDCTIDYNPGPNGDPANDHCIVPTDTSYLPQPWDCGPIDTGTGPNAINLRSMEATSSSSALPLALGLVGVSALAGGLFVWRRKQTVA